MKKNSTLKKVLNIVLFAAIAITSVGKKAQGQDVHSAFFKKSYSSTEGPGPSFVIAKDLRAGRLKLSPGVDTLEWINSQLANWNKQLLDSGVLRTNGYPFQLNERYILLSEAVDYMVKVLSEHCSDISWPSGTFFVLDRVNSRSGEVTNDWMRTGVSTEICIALDPNSFEEVSQADGEYPLLFGFSAKCGNKMVGIPKKQKPVYVHAQARARTNQEPQPQVVANDRQVGYRPISVANTTTNNTTNNYYSSEQNQKPRKNVNVNISVGLGFSSNRSTGYQQSGYPAYYPIRGNNVGFNPIRTWDTPQFNTWETQIDPTIQGDTWETQINPPIQGNTGGISPGYVARTLEGTTFNP